MKDLSYYRLNKELYKSNFVRYSWKWRNLDGIKKFLEEKGYEVQMINRNSWDTTWYVRDGSFLILEDTLVVRKGKEKIADITRSKAIVSKSCEEVIKYVSSFYRMPLSLRSFAFILATSFLLLLLLLTAKPDRSIFEIIGLWV
jgi:hypothetical protein